MWVLFTHVSIFYGTAKWVIWVFPLYSPPLWGFYHDVGLYLLWPQLGVFIKTHRKCSGILTPDERVCWCGLYVLKFSSENCTTFKICQSRKAQISAAPISRSIKAHSSWQQYYCWKSVQIDVYFSVVSLPRITQSTSFPFIRYLPSVSLD